MEVRGPKRLVRNVPSLLEDRKVGKGNTRRLRASGEHGEDRRVAMIFRETPARDEGIEVIFVWNIAATCISVNRPGGRASITHFPCQATTSNGVCSCLQMNSWPPSLYITVPLVSHPYRPSYTQCSLYLPNQSGPDRSARSDAQSHEHWRARLLQEVPAQATHSVPRRSLGRLGDNVRKTTCTWFLRLTADCLAIRKGDLPPDSTLHDRDLTREHHQSAHTNVRDVRGRQIAVMLTFHTRSGYRAYRAPERS